MAALAIPNCIGAQDLGSASRQFVADLPKSASEAMCSVPAWVAGAGPDVLDPLVVISGMVFAVMAYASWSVRLTWFESVSWERTARLLAGSSPALTRPGLPS